MKRDILIAVCICCVILVCFADMRAGTSGGPVVSAKLFGASTNEVISDIHRLPNKNILVCGYTSATDWVPNASGFAAKSLGSEEAFVAILSERFDSVLAFTYFGGSANDRAVGVASQSDGTVIVVGTTTSQNIPIVDGGIAKTYTAGIDGFLCAFSADLHTLTSSTYIPGTQNDIPFGVVVDSNDYVHVFGSTNSNSGFVILSALQISNGGDEDGFWMRVAPNLTGVVNSTFLGGESKDAILAVSVLSNGDIAFTGRTASPNFPTYPKVNPQFWWQTQVRPYDFSYNSDTDAFVGMATADGSQMLGCTFFGGIGEDIGTGIHIDNQGVVAVTGTTTSSDLPTIAPLQATLSGQKDMFFATFTSDARQLLSATYMGGTGNDKPVCLEKLSAGIWNIVGVTDSKDFPTKGTGSNAILSGSEDVCILAMSGSFLQSSTLVGWQGQDIATSAAVDEKGDVIVAGASTTRSITVNSLSTTENAGSIGTQDGLLFKHAYGTILLVTPIGGELLCSNAPTTISWQTDGLLANETFDIDVSTDRIHWETKLQAITGTSVQATFGSELAVETPYILRVRDSRGHTSMADDNVQFVSAATVEALPTVLEVCTDKEAFLTCTASGSYLKYQWRRNKKNILGETSSRLKLSTGNPNVTGSYDVMVMGGCNQSILSSPTEVILSEPIVIEQQPTGGIFQLNKPATLRVLAKGKNIRYQWYKNDTEIVGATDSVLTLQVTAQEFGEYYCMLSTDCSAIQTARAVVEVTSVEYAVDKPAQIQPLLISPNPTSSDINIVLPVGAHAICITTTTGITSLSLYDSIPFGDTSIQLPTATLPIGVYTVVVQDARGRNISIGRLVKI